MVTMAATIVYDDKCGGDGDDVWDGDDAVVVGDEDCTADGDGNDS